MQEIFYVTYIECNSVILETLCQTLLQELKLHVFRPSVTNVAVAVTLLRHCMYLLTNQNVISKINCRNGDFVPNRATKNETAHVLAQRH